MVQWLSDVPARSVAARRSRASPKVSHMLCRGISSGDTGVATSSTLGPISSAIRLESPEVEAIDLGRVLGSDSAHLFFW